MRSPVFVLILGVCLLALQCAATAEGVDGAEISDQQKSADSLVTTEADSTLTATKTEREESQPHGTPKADPTEALKQMDVQPQPRESLTEEKQQPQQLSKPLTNEMTDETQGETGETILNGDDTVDTGRTEDQILKSQIVKEEKDTKTKTGHQGNNALNQASEKQILSSSNRTKIEGTQTQQKKPTFPIAKEHTLTEGTESTQTRTEENPKNQNNDQGKSPASNDDKKVLLDTNKIPITPAGKTPVPADKPETLTPDAAYNTVHQTSPITADKKHNPIQTSVTSTLQPVNGESILPANSSKELSKALQSLDNKDSNRRSSSLVLAFATLFTITVMPLALQY